MFWKILTGVARTAVQLNHTVAALGAAVVIVLGVHDYVKARNKNQRRFLD